MSESAASGLKSHHTKIIKMQRTRLKILLSVTDGALRSSVLAIRKVLLLILVLLSGLAAYSQEVTVKATTNPKEIKAILAKEREATRINRAFFDEQDKCRSFLKAREFQKAEASCRFAVSLVEKLPSEHVLERSSARTYLGIALLSQGKTQAAIPLLKKSLEIRIPEAGESDADTADIYSWLATAYGLLGEVQSARSYFEKAESSYRGAFVVIGDDCDGMRFSYPRRMKAALEAHYHVVKVAGLVDEADKLRLKLADVEKEFASYLGDQNTQPTFVCK